MRAVCVWVAAAGGGGVSVIERGRGPRFSFCFLSPLTPSRPKKKVCFPAAPPTHFSPAPARRPSLGPPPAPSKVSPPGGCAGGKGGPFGGARADWGVCVCRGPRPRRPPRHALAPRFRPSDPPPATPHCLSSALAASEVGGRGGGRGSPRGWGGGSGVSAAVGACAGPPIHWGAARGGDGGRLGWRWIRAGVGEGTAGGGDGRRRRVGRAPTHHPSSSSARLFLLLPPRAPRCILP